MLRAPVLVLVLLAASLPALAEEPRTLAHYLPAGTPAYLQIRNPTPDELKASALGKALQDPEIQALLSGLFGEGGASEVPIGDGTFSVTGEFRDGAMGARIRFTDAEGPHDIVLRDGLSFAWVGLQASPFPADLVVGVDVGDAREASRTVLRLVSAFYEEVTHGRGKRPPGKRAPVLEPRTFLDRPYFAGTIGPVEICLVPLDDLLVVTTGEERARRTIEFFRKGPTGSLAEDPRFRAMLERAPGTGTATTVFTLQVDRALDAVAAHFPGPVMFARQWLANLGLDGLKGLSTVARVDGRGVSSLTTLSFTGPRDKGLGRLFSGGEAATFEGLRFAPKDTVYTWSGRLDFAGLFDIVAEAIGSTGQMGPAILQAQFQRTFGLDLKEDLLGRIGPEVTLIVAGNGGLLPDIGLVLDSPDPARLQASILHMLEQVDWPDQTGVHTFRNGDATAYSVPLLHPGLAPVPLAPTFGVVDGKLLVTLHPLGFQRFAAVRRGAQEGLAANRDFAKLRERVPAGARDMSYLDLRRVYGFCYETLIPLLQSIPHPSGKSPLATMPPAAPFLDHLYGRIAWRTADDEGLHWFSHGSADTSGIFIMMAAGAGAATMLFVQTTAEPPPPPQVALPAGAEKGDGRLRDVRTCRANCRVLRARILLYQNEHGRMPASLEDLKAKHIDPETFVVPGSGGKAYTYVGADSAGTVLLYGAPNGPDGRITVLTKDLAFQRLTPEELKRQLER